MTTELSVTLPIGHSAPAHSHLSESESDLTDLSDIEMDEEDPQSLQGDPSEEDVKPIIDKRQASPTWDNNTDADSDYEAKPNKKKAKKSSSTSNPSASRTKANEKGKGKLKKKRGKKIVDPDEEEDKPKKKVVLAKEVYWKDIPDWGDRTDCPLLRLPEDVLDMCFGLTSGLGIRDYVALAGVSRYFKHHFTPDIFHSICWSREIHHVSAFSSHGSKIVKPETPASPITSSAEKWRTGRWNYPRRSINTVIRPTIYPQVLVKTGPRHNTSFIRRNKPSGGGVSAMLKFNASERKWTNRVKETPNESNTDPDIEDIQEKEDKNKRNEEKSRGKSTRSKRWRVPDTDTEEEYEILPHQYINEDEILIYDHWLNEWRDLAVQWINNRRINKSEAMRIYKVTDSELLCLKHVLVTNPMSTKTPQQALLIRFLEAAVEALAWRSHGACARENDSDYDW
ncbi:hypothetical protein V865_004032 [Kwoniella europaea PYCC6329]|uniref:F-box domain-containing protein n=1 Tax=Kwoniella europaea PYCC6329 TaxID=1423913 RepID=A0AAX4KJN9_9TREE